MCGLYASIAFAPERARIDRVAHRGPDGSGWREFASAAGPVALGHRRLAIIDLSEAGLQPMADASGRYHLVLNGEIYNYLELRDELRAKGHQFSSDTDSEVLLAAYREWGEDCLHRFLGMFAFLIWDERDQILFAARDRFGIKPLYVAVNQRGIAFASEIKQLLGLPGLSGRMNLARVRDFLAAGMSDHTQETLFEGVVQLQPGCCVAIAAGRAWTGRIEPKRWYAIPPHGTLRLSEAEAAEQFRSLLTDSVRLHLRSDAPVGSCLSGGLDSSSIVCLMSRMLDAEGRGARVNTVSACYEEKAVDETPFMNAVVAQAGATPHRVFPRPEDVFARASDLTWHQDEPFGSTSIFAQWCVFEEARRAGIKVMLDGQGADEALAGYHWTYAWHLLTLIRQGRLTALASTVSQRVGAHGCGVVDQLTRLAAVALPPRLAQALKAGRSGAGRRLASVRGVRDARSRPRRARARERHQRPAAGDRRGDALRRADLLGEPPDAAALGGPQLDGALDRGAGAVPRSSPRRVRAGARQRAQARRRRHQTRAPARHDGRAAARDSARAATSSASRRRSRRGSEDRSSP